MNTTPPTKSQRPITLREDSWALLDGACKYNEKLTPGILLDAIIHGYANSVDEEKQQRIVELVREEMGKQPVNR